jgi:hypothetical protein
MVLSPTVCVEIDVCAIVDVSVIVDVCETSDPLTEIVMVKKSVFVDSPKVVVNVEVSVIVDRPTVVVTVDPDSVTVVPLMVVVTVDVAPGAALSVTVTVDVAPGAALSVTVTVDVAPGPASVMTCVMVSVTVDADLVIVSVVSSVMVSVTGLSPSPIEILTVTQAVTMAQRSIPTPRSTSRFRGTGAAVGTIVRTSSSLMLCVADRLTTEVANNDNQATETFIVYLTGETNARLGERQWGDVNIG